MINKKLPVLFVSFFLVLFCLFLFSRENQIKAVGHSDFEMATGKYNGNGTPQSISGLGFQPIVVIIKADAAEYAVWRSDKMVGDSTATFYQPANFTGGITSLDTDGFSVGSDTSVNTAATMYYYIAFGDNGAGDIFTGSYTGNGTDDRNITGVGFQPVLVWIKGDITAAGRWRSSSHIGDSSSYFSSVADTANFIQNFQADGFQIGDDYAVNNLGSTYYYVAFKLNTSQLAIGDYTGNGLDNHIISGFGFSPEYLWVKSSSTAQQLRHVSNQSPSNSSFLVVNQPNESDNIKSLGLDTFTLGTSDGVNTDTVVYHYVAWENVPVSAPPNLGPTATTSGLPKTGRNFGNSVFIFCPMIIILGFVIKKYNKRFYQAFVKEGLISEIREFLDQKRSSRKNSFFND